MLMMIYSHLMFIIMRLAVFLFAGDLEVNVQVSALLSILLSLDAMITISIYLVPKIIAARSDSPGNQSSSNQNRSDRLSGASANQDTQANKSSAGHWSVASITARANEGTQYYNKRASDPGPGGQQGNSHLPSCLKNDAKLSTATEEKGTQREDMSLGVSVLDGGNDESNDTANINAVDVEEVEEPADLKQVIFTAQANNEVLNPETME